MFQTWKLLFMSAVLTLTSHATNKELASELPGTYDLETTNFKEVQNVNFSKPSCQKTMRRSFTAVAGALMALFILLPWVRKLQGLQPHALKDELPSREEKQEVDTSGDNDGDRHLAKGEDEKCHEAGREGVRVS